jgi:hypothetical protein
VHKLQKVSGLTVGRHANFLARQRKRQHERCLLVSVNTNDFAFNNVQLLNASKSCGVKSKKGGRGRVYVNMMSE